MKKFLLITASVLIFCACFFSFAGCTNRNSKITVNPCWANNESLVYTIHDSSITNNPPVGTLTVDLKANSLTDAEKTLVFSEEQKSYSSATVRITEKLIETGICEIETTILANDYTVLATNKKYKDLQKNDNSYTLWSYHNGNNYVYCIKYENSETKEGQINVGSSYTDNEFLYYYIRCYDIGSLPSKTKIADPFNGSAFELSCASLGTVDVITECTDTVIKTKAHCNGVAVSYSSDPTGSPINVFYLADSDDYKFGDYGLKSKKFPAKIVENNISYVLKSYEASYQK